MLSSSGIIWPKMAPIWFLSAMFLTMPLLIFLIRRFGESWNILCYLLPILYFGEMGINTNRVWPNDLLRAFAGMALGTFVFVVVNRINKLKLSTLMKLILTVVEVGTFLVSIYITVFNKDCMNLLLLLFVVNACIMLSGCSYSSELCGCFFGFLGEISLPMFLFHWVIGTIVARIPIENSVRVQIYYVATVILSAIVIWIKKGTLIKGRNRLK